MAPGLLPWPMYGIVAAWWGWNYGVGLAWDGSGRGAVITLNSHTHEIALLLSWKAISVKTAKSLFLFPVLWLSCTVWSCWISVGISVGICVISWFYRSHSSQIKLIECANQNFYSWLSKLCHVKYWAELGLFFMCQFYAWRMSRRHWNWQWWGQDSEVMYC